MKILHLSDTHGLHHRIKDMPEADVIIHSGDISNSGTEEEVLDFLNWMIKLPYQHKIFVTGNHDFAYGMLKALKTYQSTYISYKTKVLP